MDVNSIIEALDTLTVADLRRVKAEVDRIAELHAWGQTAASGLLDNTKPESHPTYRQEYTRCGKPTCKKCSAGAGHGPYWYSYQHSDGRMHKEYLGKNKPAELQQRELAALRSATQLNAAFGKVVDMIGLELE
jgi:hypothetical protein